MKILIADDTASDRIVLKSYLKQLGHEVLETADGQQAVAAFKEAGRSIDLVILDVLMPNVDGHTAAGQIREVMGDEWIPIIFLSGLSEDDDLVMGLDAGGDDYLFKPVNKVVLTAKMNAMKRISQLRHKLTENDIARERQNQKYESLVEDIGERYVLYSHAIDGTVGYINDGIKTVFGLSKEDIIGKSFYKAIQWCCDPDETFKAAIDQLVNTSETSVQFELSFIHPDGGERSLVNNAHLTYSDDGSETYIDGLIEDITERKATEQLILKQSLTDELTQLLNRKAFNQRMGEMIDQFERYAVPFCLVLLDIDHFKKVNDAYGHQKGDEVLVSLGKTMKASTRRTDLIYRIGGEEFAILLTNTELEQGASFAEKLRLIIKEKVNVTEDETITVSMGVARVREEDDRDRIFKRADDNLYKAKQSGRNRVVA